MERRKEKNEIKENQVGENNKEREENIQKNQEDALLKTERRKLRKIPMREKKREEEE